MAQSPLLTLARESILEVFQAENIIDRAHLIAQFPLLKETINTQVTIYIDNKVHNYSTSLTTQKSLLEDIVYNAKAAAFLNKKILNNAMYLHSEIEVALLTFISDRKQFVQEEFLNYLNNTNYGLILQTQSSQVHIPAHINHENINEFLSTQDVNSEILHYTLYTLEKARDRAIIAQEENTHES